MKKIRTAVFISAILLITLFTALTVGADSLTVTDEGRLPFEDVNENQWCYDEVCFCYANGLIKGMSSYSFAPQGSLTRAQFVVMFANIEGVDTDGYEIKCFTDVKSGHWFYSAVAWAYNEGLVSGMSKNSFAPNQPMTRAQMATMLTNYMKHRYEVETDAALLDGFSDKPKADYWYYESMAYAVSAGLIQGMPDGTLAPTAEITRAQAARIIMLFVKDYYSADCDHFIEPADCTLSERCVYCGLKLGIPLGHRVEGVYNCVSAETKCLDCGKSVKSSKLIHDFAPATCAVAKKCRLCGGLRGNPTSDHKMTYGESCTDMMYCTVCGYTNGIIPGHDWTDSTCKTLRTCRRCAETSGVKKDHNYKNGKCSVCGQASPLTMYDNLVAALKNKGVYDSKENTYTYTMSYTISYNGYEDLMTSALIYDASKGCIVMSYIEYDDYDGYVYSLTAPVYKGKTKCNMLYMKLSVEGEVLAGGETGWRMEGWFPDTEPRFDEYYGDYSHMWDAPTQANFCRQSITADANKMIAELCGGDIECLGFDLYSRYLP